MVHHFIGLEVNEAVRNKALQIQKQLHVSDYYKHITHPEDLHLTMLFLGGWKETYVLWGNLKEKTLPAVSFTVSKWSFFGSEKKPRVLILKAEKEQNLKLLQEQIEEEAVKLGFPSSGKLFRPHITTAKKYGSDKEFPFKTEGSFEPVYMQVNALTLFQVNPGSRPMYKKVDRIPLADVYRGNS
ncbi:RNA 2',3'-cyclic phosphodiesterase [Alkalicoccus halolimnae]|uniref:RNA 2',3'-cyclic phosphodiesterase n=1 Tax=Alkalicoccus halolimnae TaxID=1667239 RepID=A0AAJ8LSC4_9BACI|nr:RNA 2',3'-cyclic phosphodiesterase [Alkalicoccus halolimnae]